MKHSIFLMACLLVLSPSSHAVPSLDDLQGAWWSSGTNPTADFSIRDEQVWLDSTGTYHPCYIDEDILVFELGEAMGTVRNRIISLEDNELTLESLRTGKRRVLHRKRRP